MSSNNPNLPHPSPDEVELMERRQQVYYLCQNLEATYGVPQDNSSVDVLDALIETILSQATTNQNSHRTFANLKAVFPRWDSVRCAQPSEIENAIKLGGLARVKSLTIKNILNEIYQRTGSLDLSFLRQLPLEQAREWLSSLKGVGPKTVGCVLLFACKQPVFPMDTHIFRILRRAGLLPEKISDQKAHELIERLMPEKKHFSLHINLILHGRQVCRPQKPLCQHCCLIEYCQTGQATL